MDLKVLADGVMSLPNMTALLREYWYVLLIAAPFLFPGVVKGAVAAMKTGFSENWQLFLLASTGIALSVASGYTTWDGLRNFTQAPLLSVLIAFGIQGVMLIVAWLIGESFARGMHQRGRNGDREGGVAATCCRTVLAILLVGLVFYWVLTQYDAVSWAGQTPARRLGQARRRLALFRARHARCRRARIQFPPRRRIVDPLRAVGSHHRQDRGALGDVPGRHVGVRVFLLRQPLQRDFPAGAAPARRQIRAVNQVGRIIADIGAMTQKRQLEEADRLFQSAGWAAYEKQLGAMVALANKAPDVIRAQIERELKEQESRLATLEGKRADAEGRQAGLAVRRTQLGEELNRLVAERPEAATKTQEQKTVVGDAEKRLDEQRTRTLAEEKGVEGTGKVGRGQFYRASKADEDRIVGELQVARERLKSHDTRLTGIDKRSATIKAELAQIDGDLAKLKGEAGTATQLIAVTQTQNKDANTAKFDPAAGVAQIEQARQAFRQKPEDKSLATLQRQCAMMHGAVIKVASLRDEAYRIDCDPKQASESAARVFALNNGLAAFTAKCAGGDKLPQEAKTEQLLQFGRKCLQDSGLVSADANLLGGALSTIDMNRDDKAHRFVVTWNAFLDGNRLAYLSLILAIAVDGLVFMSGLFGAQAMRSPLTDMDGRQSLTAEQLEKLVDGALRTTSDPFATIRAINALSRPVSDRAGFASQIDFEETHAYAGDIKIVLLAASTIDGIAPVGHNSYLVKKGLAAYFNTAAEKFGRNTPTTVDRHEVQEMLEWRSSRIFRPTPHWCSAICTPSTAATASSPS